MSGFTVDQPAQIQAEGAPGVLMAGSNTKVKGSRVSWALRSTR